MFRSSRIESAISVARAGGLTKSRTRMKTLALGLLIIVPACGGPSPPPAVPTCPQHRVEPFECMSSTGTVLAKDGRFCASCAGVDATGTPTAKPVGCTTVAGDLCVADCGECS
jgi:hypothetical protein